MRDAEVLERGPVERVLTAPTHPYTRRLLAAEPAHWARGWMRPAPPPDDDRPVLVQARGVGRTLGGRPLLADLDLDLHAGDPVGLTGPSGSGKTTLGRALLPPGPCSMVAAWWSDAAPPHPSALSTVRSETGPDTPTRRGGRHVPRSVPGPGRPVPPTVAVGEQARPGRAPGAAQAANAPHPGAVDAGIGDPLRCAAQGPGS